MSFLFVVLPFVYPWGRWEIVGTNQKHGGDKCCLGNKWQYLKLQFRVCISTIIFLRLKCFAYSLYHFNGIFSFSLPTGSWIVLFSFCEKKKERTDDDGSSARFLSHLTSSRHRWSSTVFFLLLYHAPFSLFALTFAIFYYMYLSNNNKSNPSASATVYRTASFAVIRLGWRLVMKEPEKFYSCSTLELSFKRRNLPTHFNSLNAALYISFHVFPREQQKNVFFPFFL